MEQPVSVLRVRLENYTILKNILSELAETDICHLIPCHTPLFGDKPTQTTDLQHDIVSENKPINQHAYYVNPVKRDAMQKDVEYLLENCLVVPSSSLWSSPSSTRLKPRMKRR